MVRVITLKFSGTCIDCKRTIPKGVRVKWYGKSRIACLTCNIVDGYSPVEPIGMPLSRHDPHGVYTMNGEKIGSMCKCEDYPCCGH